jgi:RES domain-containing protein
MNDSQISAYRIVAPKWAHDALSGEGARKFGGRWNSPGRAMVYLGGSRALTALEMLVHLPTPLSRAKPYIIIEMKIPRHLIDDYPLSLLPDGWRNSPPAASTCDIGNDWLQAGGQLALRIPSILIPEETNILLNPLHPDFGQITEAPAATFSFDSRL